MSEDIEV